MVIRKKGKGLKIRQWNTQNDETEEGTDVPPSSEVRVLNVGSRKAWGKRMGQWGLIRPPTDTWAPQA